jgi:acyl-CoA synthetase (AMP-forming)/AMP-acid ligase II
MISGATPASSAIEGVDGRRMTYGQLKANARKIVSSLNAAGFRRNDRISVALPNGPELAVAMVSVASGFTAVPMSPDLKEEEFERYLSALRLKAVLAKAGTVPRHMLSKFGLDVFELAPDSSPEAGAFSLSSPSFRNQDLAEPEFTEPKDTVLVLMTSGTTALPKRIPITNGNFYWGILQNSRDGTIDSTTRLLIFFPLTHAAGAISLWRSILNGGTVICPHEMNPVNFYQWLDNTQANAFFAAPPVHQIILDMAENHKDSIARSDLRWLMTGSASIRKDIMEKMEETFKAPVIEAYGSTETIGIGFSPLPPRKHKYAAVMPVVPGLEILDDKGKALPVGALGEIAVRGPNVFSGYEDDPEENARVFSNGWFRTGDLGFMDGEGYLHLGGRVKDIINKGGRKISPAEVDEALMDHPAVSDALAFPVPHPTLGEDVDAAVVLRTDRKVTEGELRAFLFQRLEYFKVPTRIVVVREIPKGPMGKVNRQEAARALMLVD